MSTLIKRICAPQELTIQEKILIDAEVPTAINDGYKIPVHSVTAMAQEIIKGRLSASGLSVWLTTVEQAEANALISDVVKSIKTFDEMERVFFLGERGIYSWEQVRDILIPTE